jgi:hypothetical protein
MKDEYTLLEKQLTEAEIEDFRQAMREENDDMPRGFFIGLRNVAAIWIATIVALAMIYALIKLPGLP